MRRATRDEAFTDFVASRQAHLRRVAYALCGDWHQADDLVQIALSKLYVAWPRVQRDGREEAYVRQILVRTNIDEFRRPWRSRETIGIDGYDPVARADSSFEENRALFDAIQSLPEMQRKVVVLRHWLGLSVAETASELGVSDGTVKSHSHRAIQSLQKILQRHFVP